jgi:gluconolactonase
VVRRETDGTLTVLADRFEGRRLNSPNDAIVTAAGEVWFTDPPFGLPEAFADPGKELPFQGVYRVREPGAVELLTAEIPAPNGLALAPDGRTLYVSNAQPGDAAVYAFPVRADGSLGEKRKLFDATERVRAGAAGSADGLEVDRDGNVWFAGPGGVHLLTPGGELLGSLEFARPAANLELAADGSLYVAADTAVWRIPVGAAVRAANLPR